MSRTVHHSDSSANSPCQIIQPRRFGSNVRNSTWALLPSISSQIRPFSSTLYSALSFLFRSKYIKPVFPFAGSSKVPVLVLNFSPPLLRSFHSIPSHPPGCHHGRRSAEYANLLSPLPNPNWNWLQHNGNTREGRLLCIDISPASSSDHELPSIYVNYYRNLLLLICNILVRICERHLHYDMMVTV